MKFVMTKNAKFDNEALKIQLNEREATYVFRLSKGLTEEIRRMEKGSMIFVLTEEYHCSARNYALKAIYDAANDDYQPVAPIGACKELDVIHDAFAREEEEEFRKFLEKVGVPKD